MSTLKLFGFQAEEQQSLRGQVKADWWAKGQVEELRTSRPAGEVWVVHVDAAEDFLEAVFSLPEPTAPPPAVLWVPQKAKGKPFDEWWEGFHAQLWEESEADRAFLEKLGRCARVLEWGERVEDLSAGWFAGLTGSPRFLELSDLPFSEEEKAHLRECAACREEAMERLQGRAEMRWRSLCPTVEEIAGWLEAEGTDQRLETHVRGCALCRETVKRQAFLWEGAGLLTAAQVDRKLAAVGLAKPAKAEPAPEDWLTFEWEGQGTPETTLVEWAALLACALRRRTPTACTRSLEAKGLEEGTDRSKLEPGKPLGLAVEGKWVYLAVEEKVYLRAGPSPTGAFKEFCLEFRQGEEAVVSVSAEGGVVQLLLEHFQAAQEGGADRVVIRVASSQSRVAT